MLCRGQDSSLTKGREWKGRQLSPVPQGYRNNYCWDDDCGELFVSALLVESNKRHINAINPIGMDPGMLSDETTA
jgi:hypothetical protein